jgi:hypothetical protein
VAGWRCDKVIDPALPPAGSYGIALDVYSDSLEPPRVTNPKHRLKPGFSLCHRPAITVAFY